MAKTRKLVDMVYLAKLVKDRVPVSALVENLDVSPVTARKLYMEALARETEGNTEIDGLFSEKAGGGRNFIKVREKTKSGTGGGISLSMAKIESLGFSIEPGDFITAALDEDKNIVIKKHTG